MCGGGGRFGLTCWIRKKKVRLLPKGRKPPNAYLKGKTDIMLVPGKTLPLREQYAPLAVIQMPFLKSQEVRRTAGPPIEHSSEEMGVLTETVTPQSDSRGPTSLRSCFCY